MKLGSCTGPLVWGSRLQAGIETAIYAFLGRRLKLAWLPPQGPRLAEARANLSLDKIRLRLETTCLLPIVWPRRRFAADYCADYTKSGTGNS